jgi:hypothetical protein
LALLPVRERLWNHGREWTSTPNITFPPACYLPHWFSP